MAKMTDYADLEIGLHRRDADSYGVELRFSQPKSDAEVRLVQGGRQMISRRSNLRRSICHRKPVVV